MTLSALAVFAFALLVARVLTNGVRALSKGFTDNEWISTVAPPVMAQLTQRVVWPSDLRRHPTATR